ncbi:MAG TPA: DUF6600 domain-containing protein, partial [Acidobacteriaceae bacterium]|nr:DUF6600 domain-containing protein [Acidobacteriaceae bacterium]
MYKRLFASALAGMLLLTGMLLPGATAFSQDEGGWGSSGNGPMINPTQPDSNSQPSGSFQPNRSYQQNGNAQPDGAAPANNFNTDGSNANGGNPDGSAPDNNNPDSGNPPATVGRLSGVAGTVTEEPAGVNQWSSATENSPLSTGDRLYADQDGRAEIEMGQTVAYAWHDTDMTVTNLTDQIIQLGLSQGTLRVRTFGLNQNQAVEVDTPNGAITVTQPGAFRVDAYPNDGGTQVTVTSGAIQITGPNLSRDLNSDQSVRLTGTNPIDVATVSMPGRDALDTWSEARDQNILAAQSNPNVNPNTVGGEDLNEYGTWSNTPDYGPIWYPAQVAPGWMPYSMGQWVWVAPWGWTWVDAEPWGFAPFHYGRWAMWGGRWGWVPGPYAMAPIYSPALVGWVGGAGVGIGVGFGGPAWFPLGPGEPFYPWYHCGPGYFGRVNISNIYDYRRYNNIRDIGDRGHYGYYHSDAVMQNIHFTNRRIATTAMRQSAFASGARITPQTAIHPTAAQLHNAAWIPHPSVQPTLRSVVSRPVSRVPVSSMRPIFQSHPMQQNSGIAQRAPFAPQRGTAAPNFGDGRFGGARPLIQRNAAPGPMPTFQQRQPAMLRDPGRPLDPWQVNNLSRGRP